MPQKLPSLQPLRAIAFIGIFFLHAGALVNWSSLAVSTFFVLSGFLMVYTYIDRDIDLTLKGCFCFALSKIKKLYPLHILMLLLAAFRETFLVLYTRGGYEQLAKIFTNLLLDTLLVQSWFTPTSINCSLNGVAWYLSATLFLYLVFPLILDFIKKINNKKQLIAIALVILLIQYLLSILFIEVETGFTDIYSWATYISPLYRLGDFTIGCITGYIFIKNPRKNSLTSKKATMLELLVILLSVLVIVWTEKGQTSILVRAISENQTLPYIPLAVMLVLIFAYNNGAITKLLKNKPLIWLGDMSGYTYLIHLVVIGYTLNFLCGFFDVDYKDTLIRAGLILLEFVITLVAAKIYLILKTKISDKYNGR